MTWSSFIKRHVRFPFDVLEYQALRRMMDDGVPLERHHLFRHGLLESTVFHRPDRAAISFSKLIDIGGLEASNFELIYEQAFSHLDEALQIRLLKAWELTVSGEAQVPSSRFDFNPS